jgi:hypothetical protein
MKVLVSHGNERLITAQPVACNEGGRRLVRGIIEPGNHNVRRLVEDTSVVQPNRRLPLDLKKNVTIHNVAYDPARMGVTTRLLCWLEGDTMDFDAIDMRVEQAGEQMDADNVICAVALVLCHDLFLFRYKLSMI